MGQLIDGVWKRGETGTPTHHGRFERQPSVFHNWVTRDGAPGPTGEGGFAAETGR
jgi:putative glutathione S-transferase